MSQRVPMTKGGLLRLKEELKRLKNVERPKIVKEIVTRIRGSTRLTMRPM